jgi:8-oxo-dGTP diphosphatase
MPHGSDGTPSVQGPFTPGVSDGVVAMVGALLVAGDFVLLGYRHPGRAEFAGTWDMIGGHVEPDETPAEALGRELYEELGITAELGPPFATLRDHDLSRSLTVWRVARWSGAIENRAPDEHGALCWFSRHEVRRLEFPQPGYVELITAVLP